MDYTISRPYNRKSTKKKQIFCRDSLKDGLPGKQIGLKQFKFDWGKGVLGELVKSSALFSVARNPTHPYLLRNPANTTPYRLVVDPRLLELSLLSEFDNNGFTP